MAGRTGRMRAAQPRRFFHLLIILLGFALIFVGKADTLAVRTVQTSFSGLFAPLFNVVATPVRAVETMFEGMRTVASLREETVRLRAENERLKRWQRRSEILESENRQLRTVLGAVIPADRQAVTARAIAAPGSSFSHTMMITHGTDKRIHRGDPVVTADGLVGYIIEVSKRHSWVLMLSDVNSRIPILLSTSSWPGLAIGQNSDVLSLSFLPLEAEPKENELVLTSGHGEILPPGLPVGRVTKGVGGEYYIQPVVDLRKVSFVSILVRPVGEGVSEIGGFADFFTPLPETDNKRLLEGFSPKDVLQ
ncbi:MAG: rod shape-determining protein MreC [Alphaproteobacteria bacterium]|nr:rod shape-determining protein MreC [Alphaproteobacteria bacterium]MBL6776548.1 rod shape-determining protein MreC [Alphaproteobacteria bacterium]